MNNKEASFANHNLEEDLKKAQRELEKELVESKVGLIDQETSNHPQEIMVNGIKVSPEGFVDLRVNTYGRVYKKGDPISLLVGENMKKVEAEFVETIRVRLIN